MVGLTRNRAGDDAPTSCCCGKSGGVALLHHGNAMPHAGVVGAASHRDQGNHRSAR
jgi:hypothetical protein